MAVSVSLHGKCDKLHEVLKYLRHQPYVLYIHGDPGAPVRVRAPGDLR